MIHVFIFSGNYAVGKTFLSKAITNNVVALASPIRKIAFELFKDDKFYSTSQEDKEAPFPVPKTIKKPRTMKQSFYDELMAVIDDFPQTYRGVLQAIGSVGRDVSKDYWAKLTKEKIQELIINNQNVICVDDLRYVNELKILKKLSNTQTKVVSVSILEEAPLEGYELEKLLKTCDITLRNHKDSGHVTLSSKGFEIVCPLEKLAIVLSFLADQ